MHRAPPGARFGIADEYHASVSHPNVFKQGDCGAAWQAKQALLSSCPSLVNVYESPIRKSSGEDSEWSP